MGIEKVSVGSPDAQVRQTLRDTLNYGLGMGQGNGLTWSLATSRFNALAGDLALDGLADNQNGAVSRSNINAVIDALGIPSGLDLYADFMAGRMWDNGPASMAARIPDSHSGSWLPVNGVYQWFPANTLSQVEGDGLWTQPQSTRLTPYPRTPFTNWSTSGSPTKTAVSGTFLNQFSNAMRLASSGANWHRARPSFAASWTAGVPIGFAFLYAAGTSGRVRMFFWDNATSVGTVQYGPVGNAKGGSGGAGIVTNFSEREVQPGIWLASGTFTPSVSTSAGEMGISPDSAVVGEDIIVIGGWLESAPFATTPVFGNETAQAVRTGNRQVIDLTGRLGYGVAGFIRTDLMSLEPAKFLLMFSDGTNANRVRIQTNASSMGLYSTKSGGSDIHSGLAPFGERGMRTFAFGAAENFLALREVGLSQVGGNLSAPYPAGMNMLAIGGRGFAVDANILQATKKLGLVFGSPSRPINQDLFDQVYAMAVAA